MNRVRAVVEGIAELHLLRGMGVEYLEPEGGFVPNGKDSVLAQLSPALLEDGVTHVLVIRDAETGTAQSVWSEIREVLLKHWEGDIDGEISSGGFVGTSRRGVRVGVWIMPNNADAGMLEDFYLAGIAANDGKKVRAIEFVESVGEAFPTKQKNVLQVWLGIQRRPGPPGTAIKEGYFDRDSVPLSGFGAWLEELGLR